MDIGFIGLGSIGNPICNNLIKSENNIFAYDINKTAVDKLVEIGATGVQSCSDLSENCEYIFLSLPNANIIRETIHNLSLAASKKIRTIIDLSTISTSDAKEFETYLATYNINYCDAPISGGVIGAIKGELSIMVGGDKKVYDDIYPLLKIIGKYIYYVGPIGMGSAVKMINNYLLAINLVATCETMAIGKKLGLDLQQLFDILNISSGRNYFTEVKANKFLKTRNFTPGFSIDLQYKDLCIALGTAREHKFPIFIGGGALEVLEICRAKGLGKEDTMAVIKLFEEYGDVNVN